MTDYSLLLIFCLGFFNYNLTAQTNWELVYENDANGRAVQGNLDHLIQAVRAGADIKIYYKSTSPSNPETGVEHTGLIKFTTILNTSNGSTVCGQIDPIIGQTPNFQDAKIEFKKNLEWSILACTSGQCDHIMRNSINGEVVNHQIRLRGIKWYVRN